VIPDIFATVFRVAAILGYHNVFISIYENGSNDQTKALLRIFDSLTRAVGLRVTIRSSHRTRGAFNHRIEYLAEVRNAALVPLHELRDAEGETFDSVIFMNDILPCVDDLLELIWQSRRQNAGITCAADYMFHEEIGAPVFYDNWVARDINGTALENAPFEAVFHHPDSSQRYQHHLPIQVQSCWNGIAILDPEPIYRPPHVKFRMAKLVEGECSASECSLVGNDYWATGYGRIIMVPRVKLAYDKVGIHISCALSFTNLVCSVYSTSSIPLGATSPPSAATHVWVVSLMTHVPTRKTVLGSARMTACLSKKRVKSSTSSLVPSTSGAGGGTELETLTGRMSTPSGRRCPTEQRCPRP